MRIAVSVSEGTAELCQALQSEGHEPVVCPGQPQLAAAVTTCEALVLNGAHYTNVVATALRSAQSRVRWVQFASAGIDAADRWGAPAGVLLTNAAEAFAPTVAEHAFALLLAAYRRIVEMDRVRSTEQWSRETFVPKLASVEGATLAVVGYGHVGREIARRATAFGMRLIVVARRPESPRVDGLSGLPLDALGSVLPECDAVVICVALAAATRNLIGSRELAAMKPSAWLVNVARGGVVDQEALLATLQSRRIAGAALDVFLDEPLPLDSPWRTLDNVIITPHVGGFGGAALRVRMTAIVVDNVRRYSSGAPLRNEVKCEWVF